MRVRFITIIFAISVSASFAQDHTIYREIKVLTENGDTIKNPFSGGLNAPQFSEIDLNFDGIKDLFVYDREDGVIKTFINGGTLNTVDYNYSNEYWDKFPELRNFALLRDYNCDGKEDIFTGATGGMAVYKNTSNSVDGIQFELVTTLLMSDYGGSGIINLYVPSTDIPAIVDIDNDGDLDVLTFGVWGTMVEYHENRSIDLYGHCDSLTFIANTTCWGNFSENSSNNSVTLGTTCKGIVGHDPNATALHSGSTLLAIDMNADGDKELILGDVSFSNMVALINGGDNFTANIVSQYSTFPLNTTAVDLYLFPAGYYLDVDNDGIKDLIVASNVTNISENFTSVWLYKNSGATDSPIFNYVQNDFLQNNMIEVGTGANAVFEDVNQDGLLDLILGNYGYYGTSDFVSSIAYFENIGSSGNPVFQLIDRDYGGFSVIGVNGLFPAFGDIDSDGDNDLILGNYNGDLYLYENIAGAGNTYEFNLFSTNYMSIDVGQHSAPQLVDFNGNGLLDLLIAERSGNINYFENRGTSTDANFDSQPTTSEFGQIDVMIPCCTGYSTVHLTTDENNETILYVGSEDGVIYIYSNINILNPEAAFTLVDSIVTGASSVSIFTADINNSGKKEEVYGENSGGLTILHFREVLQLVSPVNNDAEAPYDAVLDWTSAPETALFYEYNIDTVSSFNSSLFNAGQTSYISSSSVDTDTEQAMLLSLNQKYFWRVRYLTNIDTSEWSETWNFTTTEDSITIANFVADDTQIAPNTTVTFTDLSSSNPTSWLWSFSGGTPSTSTAQHPQVAYSSTGSFDVQLIATNIHGTDTMIRASYITVSNNIGVAERQRVSQVLVYPNPAGNQITVKFLSTQQALLIEIISVDGKIHYKKQSNTGEEQISVRNFPPGVYFIRASNQYNIEYAKFIKR